MNMSGEPQMVFGTTPAMTCSNPETRISIDEAIANLQRTVAELKEEEEAMDRLIKASQRYPEKAFTNSTAPAPTTHLPTVAAARKAIPIYSGCLKYFPDALAAVAELSRIGNDQHNPGKPLQWDRSKSGDELDALTRHLLDAGTLDTDGIRHSAKVAWRALANLQKEIEHASNAT